MLFSNIQHFIAGECHATTRPRHFSLINVDCQQFGGTGQGHLTIRKVYGKDGIRLLRCGRCHEEFSERRNTALFNTKISEAKAEDVIDHLDEGCSVRATSRLTKGLENNYVSHPL